MVQAFLHSGLCHQPQSLSFRIVAHFAGRVEIHGCLVFSRVCRPMRQAVVIGIAGSGKIHPGSTDLLRQKECLGSASTVMVANLSVVERERDFTGVEGAGTAVQHWSPPRVYIRVCRRATQSSLPDSLLKRRATKGSGGNDGI